MKVDLTYIPHTKSATKFYVAAQDQGLVVTTITSHAPPIYF